MNFKDIPKFTRVGSWEVTMDWDYLLDWLKKKKTEMNLQLEPDFQRGHIWTEKQQIDYIEFRLKGGNTGNILYFNQPGWMFDFSGDFVCVDGLQRITAIERFIKNEIKAFGHYYREFEGKLPMCACMLVNVNNLQTRKEVLQWYLEMNEGGTPHTSSELNKVRDLIKLEELK